MRQIAGFIFALSALLATASPALSQGEDGTRTERNLQIISEMLPGRYDNANQAYFDKRLNEPEAQRHNRLHVVVKRLAPTVSPHAFTIALSGGKGSPTNQNLLLTFDDKSSPDTVRMKIFLMRADENDIADAEYLSNCDLLWREEAGQFRATPASTPCDRDSALRIPSGMLLSEDALWLRFANDERGFYTAERARNFQCYLDVPGVGGGRDIPYKRYEIENIHDKGGKAWTTLDDGSQVSITLQTIRWPMNNLKNIFTRHSFVIYIGQRENGEEKEVTYAWTVPHAQRIGVNLKWMLVNCFMLSNEDVTPFFKDEPLL